MWNPPLRVGPADLTFELAISSRGYTAFFSTSSPILTEGVPAVGVVGGVARGVTVGGGARQP